MSNRSDESALLAALREAVEARAAVSAAFMEAGRSAYAWHCIDAELASLAYDSGRDLGLAAALRSEAASIRALSFQSDGFSIEVEVTDDALLGQLLPPQPGTAELQRQAGPATTVPIDEVGCFVFPHVPAGPFRLRCQTDAQTGVRTGWVTL